MKNKSLFKILIVFVLSISLISSFAITSSSASSVLKVDTWYRFVDTPYLESDLDFDNIDFDIEGVNYSRLIFSVNTETSNYYLETITAVKYFDDGTSRWLPIYQNGSWVNESYRYIYFYYFPANVIDSDYILLRNMLETVSDSPYGGLYANVYSLIQDKIYGGYPLSGGAEIACSSVSTFLTIFVLVLPLALVWLIIKGLTSLIGRVY